MGKARAEAKGKPGMCFATLEKGKQEFTVAPNSEAREHPRSSHPLFRMIPGLTTKFVRGDGLRILFDHGVYSHLLGSIIHYLCWHDGVGAGVRQKIEPRQRLGLIFEALQKEYKRQQSPTRLTNLRLSMICDTAAPHSSYPALKAKGAESKWLAPAFLPVCKALLQPSLEHEAAMLRALQSMCDLIALFDDSGMFLSSNAWKQACALAKGFLDTYAQLHEWAAEANRKLFHIVFKFHTFQHLVENSKYLNPRAHWCFSCEDFVGKMALLAHSVSMGVRSTKISQKVCPKYKLLLDLLLTREGFELCQRQFE